MRNETDIIGICPENLAFQSNYVPLISFKNEKQQQAAEKYIITEANTFLDKILPDKDKKVEPLQLPYSKLITEKDFKQEDISYFYENLFYDLKRMSNGTLDATIKWGITFDEKCTPISVGFVSPNYTGYNPDIKYSDSNNRPYRKYGTIDINGTPVFYYIYFTLQEILDEIKKLPNS
jgi:hypothetical protein